MTSFVRALCALLLLSGCMAEMYEEGYGRDGTGRPGGSGGPARGGLSIDTSTSDEYVGLVDDVGTIRGMAFGATRVEIGPEGSASMLAGGSFSQAARVEPGLNLVEVRAYDDTNNLVRGNRSIMRADYVPQGDMIDQGVAITITEDLLAGLAGDGLGTLGEFSLDSFIMPGSPLIDSGPCNLIADSVRHDPLSLAIGATPEGQLEITVRVTNIAVGFHGSCGFAGTNITVDRGSEADETTAEVRVILDIATPPPGQCATDFRAADVQVAITSFDLDLRLSGCGLLCLFGEVIGEIAEGAVKGMLEDRFQAEAAPMVDPLLADLDALEFGTSLTFLDVPVELGMCVTGIQSEGGNLIATVGTRATGPAASSAPGAPVEAATLPALGPDKVWIDAGLLGQILFAVWSGDAFTLENATGAAAASGDTGGVPLTVDALALLAPPLQTMVRDGEIPAGAPLQIDIAATMAPLSRTPDAAERAASPDVDLYIELGNLYLTISAAGRQLFVMGTQLKLALALVPDAAGALLPTVVTEATTSTTWLHDTTISDLPSSVGDTLAGIVDGLIAEQLEPLLGDQAIDLSGLGLPLSIADVTPTDAGYLEVTLGGGSAPPPPGP